MSATPAAAAETHVRHGLVGATIQKLHATLDASNTFASSLTNNFFEASSSAAALLRGIPMIDRSAAHLANAADAMSSITAASITPIYATVTATTALAATSIRKKMPTVLTKVTGITASPETVIILQSAAFITYVVASTISAQKKMSSFKVAAEKDLEMMRKEFAQEKEAEKQLKAKARQERMAQIDKKMKERLALVEVRRRADDVKAKEEEAKAAEARAASVQRELSAVSAAAEEERARVKRRQMNLRKRLAAAVQTQARQRAQAEHSTHEAQRAHERLLKAEAELEDALARAQENEEMRRQIEAVSASNRAQSMKADLLRRELAAARRASREAEAAHKVEAAAAAESATKSQREIEGLSHKLQQVERLLRLREVDFRSELQAARKSNAEKLADIIQRLEEARRQTLSTHAKLDEAKEHERNLHLSVKDSQAAAAILEREAAVKADAAKAASASKDEQKLQTGSGEIALVEQLEAQRAAAQADAEKKAHEAHMAERQAELARAEAEAVRASVKKATDGTSDESAKRLELLQTASKRTDARYTIEKRRALLAGDAAAAAKVRYEQACLAKKDALRVERGGTSASAFSRAEAEARAAHVAAVAARRHANTLVGQVAQAKESVLTAQKAFDKAAAVELQLQRQLLQGRGEETIPSAQPQRPATKAPIEPDTTKHAATMGAVYVAEQLIPHVWRATLHDEALARAAAAKARANSTNPISDNSALRKEMPSERPQLRADQIAVPKLSAEATSPVPLRRNSKANEARKTGLPPSVRQLPLKPPPVRQLPLRPSPRSEGVIAGSAQLVPPDVAPAAEQIRTQFGKALPHNPVKTPLWVRSTLGTHENATDAIAESAKHGLRMRLMRFDANIPPQRLLLDFPEATAVEAIYSSRTGERKDVIINFKTGTVVSAVRPRATTLGCALEPIVRPMIHRAGAHRMVWTRTQLAQMADTSKLQRP